MLAGLQAGIHQSLDELAKTWQLDRRFEPRMKNMERQGLLDGWAAALARVMD